ncbi:CHAT domain-containing protein [Magnetospirillum fulvum]|uniref:Tetratricopeptide repeat-containing protein n=1 Tax=Magnetospirillum fulvum TaxID=1082 RepID=A0A1H6HWD2_MAGFU|nr:CHAT domain-containing protein [Magnetospirillum fulvum]SEH38464.1 Tetratricopeptide repeat-containing protein [Magnetospirillum fulvum]
MQRGSIGSALGILALASFLWAAPAGAVSIDEAIAEAAQAFAAGRAADVARLDSEISRLREVYPPWVTEKQVEASAVPAAKQRAAALWNRVHQQSILAAGGGDLAKALDSARQAVSLAHDNLGDGHFATIISYSDLAALQHLGGDVDAAEASYRQAIALSRAALGAGHPETLKLSLALSRLYRDQGRLEAASARLAEAVADATGAFGAGHPQTLALAFALANARLDQGKGREAGAGLDAVCAAAAATFGEVHPDFARCLALQGAVKYRLGEYAPAAALLERAIAIQAAALPVSDRQALATRLQAALTYHRQGRLAEARSAQDSVIRDAAAAGDQESVLAAKGDLADVLVDLGEDGVALATAREVLDAQTARLGPSHPSTLAALSSLASVLRRQGHLLEAEKQFDEALQRYRKALGDDHPATVVAVNNLGEILEKEGRYDRAEPVLRTALESSRRAFGENHPATMTTMNNLALLYESQGLFDKAEPLYQGVIAVFARTIGPKHPDTIASTNNLAYLYMLKGEPDRAAAMFREVYESWAKAYGPRHQNTLKALNNLARALHAQGKLKEAEASFDKALAARRATLGERHLDTLRSMHDLAALYRTTKRLPQAEALLKKTLEGDEAVLGASHPYTFETLNSLAAVQEERGETAAAFETRRLTFQRRTEFFDRVLPVTGDNAREGYVRLHAPEYSAYVALLARQNDAAAARALLEASLNRKGVLLKIASESQQIARLARDPELNRLAVELTEVRKRLAALTLSGPTAETRDNHVEIVNGLEDRVNELQGTLGRASQRFRRSVAALSLDDLIKALPPEAVLVDYVIYGDDGRQKLAAAVLRKEGDRPVFALVRFDDPAVIEAAVTKYRTVIQDEEVEIDDLLDAGEAVTRVVWQPLEAALGGRRQVYVVPDGILNILPFSALVQKNRKYLIESVDLHLLTSSRDLLPSPIGTTKGYLINAGPDYNTEAVVGRDVLEQARSRSAGAADLQMSVRGMSGLRGLHFDPLPGAEREGQLIQRTVEGQGKPTVIHSRADAQEKTLRDLEQPPEVLHIATHGFFLKPDDTLRKRLLKLQRSSDFQVPPPGDNPLLRAGLAFAGINSNAQVLGEIDTDNDGVLTALEVLGLDLTGTRLAILSACETGLGEIHEGEGVYGLRRAFQEAGVQSVVSSLWEVSDAGTQTLMAALYKRLLAGKSPHDALREAQLEMLRTPQWSTPYIWSAFFMVGG